MNAWTKYVAWVERDTVETYPMMIGMSVVIPFLPLLLYALLGLAVEPAKFPMWALVIPVVCSAVLFFVVLRAAIKEIRRRWMIASAERERH